MELGELAAFFGTAAGSAVLAILAKLGVEWKQGKTAKKKKRELEEEESAEESMVPRSDVRDAVRLARMDGKLDIILERLETHAAHDEERFGRHDARLKELGERSHNHGNWLERHKGEIELLRDRIDHTRRAANIDSGVTDVREIERRAREAGR